LPPLQPDHFDSLPAGDVHPSRLKGIWQTWCCDLSSRSFSFLICGRPPLFPRVVVLAKVPLSICRANMCSADRNFHPRPRRRPVSDLSYELNFPPQFRSFSFLCLPAHTSLVFSPLTTTSLPPRFVLYGANCSPHVMFLFLLLFSPLSLPPRRPFGNGPPSEPDAPRSAHRVMTNLFLGSFPPSFPPKPSSFLTVATSVPCRAVSVAFLLFTAQHCVDSLFLM